MHTVLQISVHTTNAHNPANLRPHHKCTQSCQSPSTPQMHTVLQISVHTTNAHSPANLYYNLKFGNMDLSPIPHQNYSLNDSAGNRRNFRFCNCNKQLIFRVGFGFKIHHLFVKPQTRHCGLKLGTSSTQ